MATPYLKPEDEDVKDNLTNPMYLDDSERGVQADEINGDRFNFDSSGEEYVNTFDSCGDDSEGDFDDAPNSNASNSSRILAQQLQILKETTIGEAEVIARVDTSTEGIEKQITSESSLTTMSQGVEGEVSQAQNVYCQKCRRLQTNFNSLNSEEQQIETTSYADNLNIRDLVVRDDTIIDILEELGTCWKVLGPVLHVNSAKLENIDTDASGSKEKANNMMTTWKQQEGKYATVGCLEQALLRIKRKDIADKLIGILGLSYTAPPSIQHTDKPLNLNIKVELTTDPAQPDTSVLLCEDTTDRKYIVKEVTDEYLNWRVEEIVDNDRVLEKMIIAARNCKKTREEKRQESLRRVSEELTQLRKRMRKVKIDSDIEVQDITTETTKQMKPCSAEPSKISQDEIRELLKMCEFQNESSQMMYKVLIKLIGEVGPLEDNSRCLKQLSEFAGELRGQEKKLVQKLDLLTSVKTELDEYQLVRLEQLKTLQETQNKQVDGIEKLLTSLLEQGNIKQVRKQTNRKSDPIFNKFGASRGAGRRRAKTDSYESKRAFLNSSTQEEIDEERKKQISLPLHARQIKML